MLPLLYRLLLVIWFTAGLGLGCVWGASFTAGNAQSVEVAEAIHQAAVDHGVSEQWLLSVAACESRYQPWVTSRGGHAGLYQFSAATWRWMSWQAGWGGASPYDPVAAAQVAGWALANGYARHWACR
jgi:soluble lytic murein transglycosylase-like protein